MVAATSQQLLLLLLLLVLSVARVSAQDCAITTARLRCEYAVDPLAVSTTTPRLSWQYENVIAEAVNQTVSAYRIVASSTLAGITKGAGDLWDTGTVSVNKQALSPALGTPYFGKWPGGPIQTIYWRVGAWDAEGTDCGLGSSVGSFTLAPMTAADWAGARWIQSPFPANVGPLPCGYFHGSPTPLFRKDFEITSGSTVQSAILHITGLGYYAAHVDGTRVGRDVLDPPWTKFNETVMFSAHDVTSLLQGACMHGDVNHHARAGWKPRRPMSWGVEDGCPANLSSCQLPVTLSCCLLCHTVCCVMLSCCHGVSELHITRPGG